MIQIFKRSHVMYITYTSAILRNSLSFYYIIKANHTSMHIFIPI